MGSKCLFFSALFLFVKMALAAGPTPGVTDTEIVVGAHTSESGKGAVGSAYAQVMRAYFSDFNAKGGVHGRKIKWIGIDTQSTSSKTVESTRSLVEKDNIFAMVGGQGPSHIAIWKYLQEKNIPDLFFTDMDSIYAKQPQVRSVFPGWYVASVDGKFQGEYIARKYKGGKNVCWIIMDTASAEQSAEASKQALVEANKNLKDNEKFTFGPLERTDRHATQANSEILKLRKEKCEIVVNLSYGPIFAASLNFAYSQGFNPQWVTFYVNVTTQILELLKPAIFENLIFTMPFATEEGMGAYNFPAYKTFVDKYKLPHSGTGARGFYSAELFTEALKRAGRDLTREKLITAVESLGKYKCSLCTEPLAAMSPTQHMPVEKPLLLGVKDGKWRLIKE